MCDIIILQKEMIQMVATVTDTIRAIPNTWFTIDINQFTGACDFASLKNDGVKHIYLRAYGSSHSGNGDTLFEQFIPYAKGQGFPLGAYYYAMPNDGTLADAKIQADQFIAKMQHGFGALSFGDLMPMLDIEDNSAVGGKNLSMPVSDLLSWINNFRNYFEDTTGVRLGLYTDGYFVHDQRNNFNEGFTSQGNIVKDMPVWMAGYTKYNITSVPKVGGFQNILAWQYSEDGVFAGAPNNKVDLSISYAPMTSQKVVKTNQVLSSTSEDTNTTQNPDGSTTTKTTIITTSKIVQVKTYQ
jgi:GH25 family lysozyme M1 (1,4-beta-N-acetylmuramidase)